MEKIDKIKEFPERLTLELTNCCNLKCVMCPRQSLDKMTGMMELDLYKNIIYEASKYLPVTLVPFFRGESLLHPSFLEMIKMAKDAGLGPIQLTTNAMLLNDEISKGLINIGLDFISFSLDVLGKESYESIRIGGDYKRVINNIESFLEIKERKHSNIPEVQVSTVETELNQNKIAEFVDYWSKKVERVRVYPEHSSEGAFGSLKEKYNIPEFDKRLPCKKVFTDMIIYWNGDVAVCNHDWDRKEYIGNVKDAMIKEIWNSRKYNEIRQRQIKGDLYNDPTCKGCDHWIIYYIPDGKIGKLYEAQS